MAAAEARAAENSADDLELGVYEFNRGAIAFSLPNARATGP